MKELNPSSLGTKLRGHSLFAAGSSVFAVLLAIASAHAQTPDHAVAPSSAQATTKTAAEQFKNIQVLKDIPADQLIPAMQFITASLGVECEYCHAHDAFDKDEKKTKVTARKMMLMMMAINKDNFEGHREVTCYSCHRGAADPVSTPIISVEETAPAEEAPGAEKAALPTAEQLLDKYLAAAGGAPGLQKITSRVAKGTATFGGQSVPVDVYAKAPDKRLSVMHLKSGDSLTAFDGHQGWLSVPGRTHMMSPAENAAISIDADFYFPIDIKTRYETFHVETGEKIDGHDTYLVIGRKEGTPPLRLYFDTKSGLLVRLVRYAETPLGRNPTQIDYADYRAVDGIKVPYRWTLARPGNRFTIQVEQWRQNVDVDDAKFAPPPPTPPPPPPKPAS
jgi:photosynthetic reaction center cytochrome c subunit